MRDHEQAMQIYARLAAISHRKQQAAGTDKFLVLTGIAATQAGWPEIAERCRALVVQRNPRHLVGHHASFADALRDEEFQPLVRRLERFCPIETAEALLQGQEVADGSEKGDSAGETAASLLSSIA